MVKFLFTILPPQKSDKTHDSFLKKMWNQINLVSLSETHVKDFDKITI